MNSDKKSLDVTVKSLLPDIQVKVPESSISSSTAVMAQELHEEPPLVRNKSQATRLARHNLGPLVRFFKNGVRCRFQDVPDGDIVLARGNGPQRVVLGTGKDYDAALQAAMKPKK